MTTKQPHRPAPGRPGAARSARRRAEVQKRREAQRRSAQLAARKRRRRIVAGVLAGVLVVGVAATSIVLVRREDPQPPSTELTSELVEDATGELAAAETPASYQVTYEITTYSDTTSTDTPTPTTEEVVVERPFNSALTAHQGATTGSASEWQLTSTLGRYAQATSGATPTVQAITPRSALGDYRLDASLEDLVADGTFVVRERRRALGRECQVYRTGSPVESLSTSAPTDTTYSDVCVDAAGIPLEEVSVSDGVLASRLLATAVDDQYAPSADAFAIEGEPTGVDAGGAELVNATEPPAGSWQPASLPEGYTLQGRYVFRQAAAEPAEDTTTTTTPGATTTVPATPEIRESYADVYVNGANTIVVLQGPVAAEPASEATDGAGVQVGTLGAATVASGLTGTTLLAHPTAPAGWFVEISGTVDRTTLEAFASSLQAA